MRYKLPVVISPLENGEYMAECEPVRAVATGDTPEEAVFNLKEAIIDLVKEFGEAKVFEDVKPETEVQVGVLEVAV
ncbi:MAG: type II toxin-antitoxin system HicB family antitoxin [Armatimonadetes bacterium]|nr:type II toxin-antitoxin system HicB family antitoxin [Armatimonadota bacterium]